MSLWEGGLTDRQPTTSYSEVFENVCAYYMSIGMTYTEFWDKDCFLAKYFREAEKIKRKNINTWLWLNGRYMYEAFIDSFPVFNPFSKLKEPLPYRDSPLPLDEDEAKQAAEELESKKAEAQRQKFINQVIAFNARFTEKGSED